IVGSGGTAAFAIVTENHAVLGTANAHGILQQRLKDTMEVKRRAANGLEHLGRGRLLPQRLAQLLGALLYLIEQPHVLDRNDRLVGEGGDELDLSLAERAHGMTVQREHANWRSFPHEGQRKYRMVLADLLMLDQLVFRIGHRIENLYGRAFEQRAPDGTRASRCIAH